MSRKNLSHFQTFDSETQKEENSRFLQFSERIWKLLQKEMKDHRWLSATVIQVCLWTTKGLFTFWLVLRKWLVRFKISYIKKVCRQWFCTIFEHLTISKLSSDKIHLYFLQICNSLTIIKRNPAGLAGVCLTHWVRDAVLTDTRPKKKYCNNSDENMLNWLLLMSAALQNAQRSKSLEKVDTTRTCTSEDCYRDLIYCFLTSPNLAMIRNNQEFLKVVNLPLCLVLLKVWPAH